VKEIGTVVISGAYVDLTEVSAPQLKVCLRSYLFIVRSFMSSLIFILMCNFSLQALATLCVEAGLFRLHCDNYLQGECVRRRMSPDR
jgi:hypothetical protein